MDYEKYGRIADAGKFIVSGLMALTLAAAASSCISASNSGAQKSALTPEPIPEWQRPHPERETYASPIFAPHGYRVNPYKKKDS